MTYYRPQDYIEHYIVPFSDTDGNEWKVSIQEPWYEGETVTLVGAAIPVEWMGRGDEDQTEVVLGSTGNLRLVVTEETETYFQKGALLPTYINDRRVQVFMMYGGQWVLFWQGFIVPESFSQDWDAAPREVELPIASVVAAMEYFTMPLKNDACYAYFVEQTSIAGLLRAIFAWSGCEVLNIVTNKPEYEDFNGQTHPLPIPGTEPVEYYDAHWTQGKVSSEYFYERENGVIRPKTFKDVLETIAYPYGKVQDYANYVIFAMRWKDDANEQTRFYSLAVWHDYRNGTYATGKRFSDNVIIPKVSLEKIITEGTDNKVSIVQPPASVQFSAEPEESTEIFELSEKYIKPSLPIGETLDDLPIEQRDFPDNGAHRALYAIHKNYVNMEFGEDWDFVNEQAEQQANWPFCRVVETKGDNNTKRFTTTTPVKLGFCFNINSTDDTFQRAKISFTIPNGVRTRQGANLIKISVKPYMIEKMDPTPKEGSTTLGALIRDLTTGKWLVFNTRENKWQWQNTEEATGIVAWKNENGEWVLWFNESRDSGDTSLHKLRITIVCGTREVLSGNTWGRMYCTFKMEYVANDFMDNVDESTYTFPSGAVLAAFAKGIKTSATVENPGGSDNLRIELKTQVGNRNIIINGSITLPTNSFCDATKYIDMGEREKIEIEAAKSKRSYYGYYYWLATQYAIVTDGSKVYIPVAVGMNPRMNSIRLTMVSTNVTSQTTS